MKTKLSISDFTILPSGFGRYNVEYKTPRRGDSWRAEVTDLESIDEIRNAQGYPTQAALKRLRDDVKNSGVHFDKHGLKIEPRVPSGWTLRKSVSGDHWDVYCYGVLAYSDSANEDMYTYDGARNMLRQLRGDFK